MSTNPNTEICKNCKHWEINIKPLNDFIVLERDEYGIATKREWKQSDAHPCNNIINIHDHPLGYSALVGSTIGKDLSCCDLWTSPDFGCSNFSQKENEDG